METKVVTGKVRLSYVNIFKPKKFNENDEEKYSVCVLIDKNDKQTLDKINRAVKAAIEEGISSKWGGKKPAKLKLPLRDGDEERADEAAEYEGMYFLNANSKQQPGIVDRKREEIFDSTEVYSGCYGRVSVNFYPYNFNGSKGVAVGLNHVQKLEDGEPLGASRASAESDFSDVDFDDLDDDITGMLG